MSWSTYIPLELPAQENMTEEEFFRFCAANKHIKIERDENKQILIMPPAGLESDNQSFSIALELGKWNTAAHTGICFGSSAGFTLPDSSVRSPDAAWVSKEKWDALPEKEKKVFGHLTPDFIAEVMSPSDNFQQMQDKMLKWIKNGVRLGWLIYPEKQLTYIYRGDGTVTKVTGFDNTLSGEDVLEDFSFDLNVLLT
jgi:Uma2 family endonuclease